MFHPGRHHSKMHLILGKKQATEENDGKRKRGKEGSHQNGRQVARPAKAGSAGSLPTGPGPDRGRGRQEGAQSKYYFFARFPFATSCPRNPPA
ncbi:MAG: hypothetical protein H6Q41_1814 [Deltaproteobacteria bacterium]|nr:hypothetical protein [Deltaproteobacteria bacterium]